MSFLCFNVISDPSMLGMTDETKGYAEKNVVDLTVSTDRLKVSDLEIEWKMLLQCFKRSFMSLVVGNFHRLSS